MKDRPILFNGEMVRAILDGRKTQTRRVIKNLPYDPDICDDLGSQFDCCQLKGFPSTYTFWCAEYPEEGNIGNWKCPFGQPGDKLWVRETWALKTPNFSYHHSQVHYKAGPRFNRLGHEHYKLIYHQHTTEPTRKYGYGLSWKDRWRPSIHMPRWASRITLKITDVRVERVQEISEADCAVEGHPIGNRFTRNYKRPWFEDLWNSTSKPETSWEANPWVWVIEFKKAGEK